MSEFDPRITPVRPDLAAAHLRGKVEAERFVEGIKKRVVGSKAPLRRSPSHEAALNTEALHGEGVTVYETTAEGWCWGQLDLDGYVGWLPNAALGDEGLAPTHRVKAHHTLVFPAPDIKRVPRFTYFFGSRVSVVRMKDMFAVNEIGGTIQSQGFIPLQHLAPIGEHETDFVGVAQRFLGMPYLWGGRSNIGLDCSGLVQIALQSAGYDCPRDSDMQAKIGKEVSFAGDESALRRGDLVCWNGHIGIVSARGRLLHANAFHMAVAEEPLSEAIARIRDAGSDVTTVRRVL